MNPPATVTAIVATRDRPAFLRRAIRSMLDQVPRAPDEIVVVFDQGEPDMSLTEEFSLHPIRVIPNRRTPGLPGARNSGLETAAGDWIALCDDDDRWTRDRLATQLGAVDDKTDFVVGGIRIEYGNRHFDRTPGCNELTFPMLLKSRIAAAHPSTFLVRRSAALGSLGPLDEDIPGLGYGEDYDWLLRAARLRPIVVVDRPLAVVAWHSTSFYRNRWRAIVDGTQSLLDKTPEFAQTRAGMARMTGHMAFALAGLGESRRSLELVARTLRLDPRQLRSYVTLAVLARLVRAEWVVKTANSFGRGI